MMQQIVSHVKPQNQGIYRTGEDACLSTGSIQITEQISNQLGAKKDLSGLIARWNQKLNTDCPMASTRRPAPEGTVSDYLDSAGGLIRLCEKTDATTTKAEKQDFARAHDWVPFHITGLSGAVFDILSPSLAGEPGGESMLNPAHG